MKWSARLRKEYREAKKQLVNESLLTGKHTLKSARKHALDTLGTAREFVHRQQMIARKHSSRYTSIGD